MSADFISYLLFTNLVVVGMLAAIWTTKNWTNVLIRVTLFGITLWNQLAVYHLFIATGASA